MATEQVADQFFELVQRFIRLRPKLFVVPEAVARFKQQMQNMRLAEKGISVQASERVQSTLEDVFTLLAHRGRTTEAV